jgi:pseudouridine-5'-phosphate glycosidase
MQVTNRAGPAPVALETTLLIHGVPPETAPKLAADLAADVRAAGASPAIVGVVAGQPIVGLTDDELRTLLETPNVPKANTANLGVLIHRRAHAATTVSATMEIAAAAGCRVFATGGIGGVHRGYATRPDISADLAAFARFPVAVVTSGVKSILDVDATREALETLGVPVIGFCTDRFPAFYQRDGGVGVDAVFEDPSALAAFVSSELRRTSRGVVIANPIPQADELDSASCARWLAEAEAAAPRATGRDATPALLAALHRVSGGATLRANIALVRSNARLAGAIASSVP